ncbi:MAG: FimB/Mfa2 family fimbrial subunit [Prevotella sp.]|nr:FimB/Mfa2 family fimbrial subunit [Prevotella sp.]
MNVRLIIQKGFVAMMAAMALSSCDMMTEDLDDCPTGLYVNFVYDYNIQRADMFKDHVGGLTLFVYDESDRLVASKTMGGSQLSKYGSYIHFTEQELAPDHTYRLMAIAFQNDQLSANGAKYRLTGNSIGDQRQQFFINLDHKATRQPDNYFYVSNATPLDTLWHTLTTVTTPADSMPKQLYPALLTPAKCDYSWQRDGSIKTNGQETVRVVSGEPTYATLSLIRDTKHLNISLREIDHPEQVSHEDYDITIIDDNTILDCENNLVAPADSVVYRPYAQWTSVVESDGQTTADYSAHYDLMFNRLRYNPTTQNNAVLCIRKKATGDVIALFNLPYILCQGRMAYEIYNYQPQEYLDREYDYRLELFLKDGRWQEGAYLAICVNALAWAKRIQFVSL